jgi:predicted negative regulator of RcsB-dependent stress response
MTEYGSDEERFSAIIDFFKHNKNTLLIIFVSVFLVAISSLSYRSYVNNQNAQAAELYDAWMLGIGDQLQDSEKASEDFNLLQQNYSSTGYAQLARMIRGSQLAREGDLDGALNDFQELLLVSSGLFANDLINSLTRLNIARIELSKERYSNALEVLDSLNSESEHPMVYEVKGDALAGLGKTELALVQYSLSMSNMQDESQKSLLKIKINKLNQ